MFVGRASVSFGASHAWRLGCRIQTHNQGSLSVFLILRGQGLTLESGGTISVVVCMPAAHISFVREGMKAGVNLGL